MRELVMRRRRNENRKGEIKWKTNWTLKMEGGTP